MKKAASFILSIVLLIGMIPNVSAESGIYLDEEKIEILQELAMRVPDFYGDDINTKSFARKAIVYIFGGGIYKKDYPYVEVSSGDYVRAVPEYDVKSEYRLIFNTDIPQGTNEDGAYIGNYGELIYDNACDSSKYTVTVGDFGDVNYVYRASQEDGNGGLYVTIDNINSENEICESPVLHIVPCDNENGFVLVSKTSYMPERNISIEINGQQLQCGQKPILMNDTVFVPMRAIFEAFNSSVSYDKTEYLKHIITAVNSKGILQMKYDPNIDEFFGNGYWNFYYTDDGDISRKIRYYGASPIILYGTTFVPVRFVSETLGADVKWDGNTKTVIINGEIPDKWSKAYDIEEMNSISYDNMQSVLNEFCEDNGIMINGVQDMWDFERGKCILASCTANDANFGLIYYYDDSVEKKDEISYVHAQQLAKAVMERENLQNIGSFDEIWSWEAYNQNPDGEYWSENDIAYLIGYYGGDCYMAYSVNKYTQQICDMGGFQDLSANAVSGFYIDI